MTNEHIVIFPLDTQGNSLRVVNSRGITFATEDEAREYIKNPEPHYQYYSIWIIFDKSVGNSMRYIETIS